MELKDILAISGQPGLYKYVAQSMRGVIVESLVDGKRMNASATSRVSALTEISMFTEGSCLFRGKGGFWSRGESEKNNGAMHEHLFPYKKKHKK